MIQQCLWLEEQDQVNNANSALILISRGCQSGWIVQGGPGGPGGQGG